MAKWDYNLSHRGNYLRELIQKGDPSKENCTQIVEQIIVCCKWLQTHLTEEDKDYYGEDIEAMIDECEDTRYYFDEYDEGANEDTINDLLDEFYDLMDEMRVWIGV